MAKKITWESDLVFGTGAAERTLNKLSEEGIDAAAIKVFGNGEGIVIMWPTEEA